MSKKYLLVFSFFIAFGIFFYAKMPVEKFRSVKKYSFQTFEKKNDRKIASHDSTHDELNKANIDSTQYKNRMSFEDDEKKLIEKNVPIRNKRIIVGENPENFEDTTTELQMINKINPDWKNILGNDLLLFQDEETKVIVREEYPIIKVIDKKGQYLEQVVITYLLKNGDQNSFRAYVDSETGQVLETWDRTIHEKMRKKRVDLAPVPMEGLITK